MSKKSERLEFRADPEFIDKIQRLADEDGVTRAEIVRRAIGLYSYAASLAQQGLVLKPQEIMHGEQEENRQSRNTQPELAAAI
jgi:predicted transcriptional regulator